MISSDSQNSDEETVAESFVEEYLTPLKKILATKAQRNGSVSKSHVRKILSGNEKSPPKVEQLRNYMRQMNIDMNSSVNAAINILGDGREDDGVDPDDVVRALGASVKMNHDRQRGAPRVDNATRLSFVQEEESQHHKPISAPIKAGQTHVMVVVRTRPLSAKEIKAGRKKCITNQSSHGQGLVAITKPGVKGAILASQAKTKKNFYAFDAAYGPKSTTKQIYQDVVVGHQYIQSLMNGISLTIFAYGATGSGKTFTMMGAGSAGLSDKATKSDGLTQFLLRDLFAFVQAQKRGGQLVKVTASYLEIYNEVVRDLLWPKSKGEQAKLIPCENPKSGKVTVLGLTEVNIDDADQLLKLVAQGNSRRVMSSTSANEFSSRSHAILQLNYHRKHRFSETQRREVSSTLSLVDLAGSERASQTKNRGQQLREGANINRSLLALGGCIKALAAVAKKVGVQKVGNKKGKKLSKAKKAASRPKYRDSKLTLMLKSALQGNSILVMLAALNPSDHMYNDSHNTLKYADRAKSISVHPRAEQQLCKEIAKHEPGEKIRAVAKARQFSMAEAKEIRKRHKRAEKQDRRIRPDGRFKERKYKSRRDKVPPKGDRKYSGQDELTRLRAKSARQKKAPERYSTYHVSEGTALCSRGGASALCCLLPGVTVEVARTMGEWAEVRMWAPLHALSIASTRNMSIAEAGPPPLHPSDLNCLFQEALHRYSKYYQKTFNKKKAKSRRPRTAPSSETPPTYASSEDRLRHLRAQMHVSPAVARALHVSRERRSSEQTKIAPSLDGLPNIPRAVALNHRKGVHASR